MIYLVGTPIGNLKDITLRAFETLQNSDYIFCEDTRNTGQLLKNLSIGKNQKLISFYDHNESLQIPKILELNEAGSEISIVSDAGLPLISDPGFKLVAELIKENIEFEVLPGACAFITALQYSGLPTHEFTFYGFVPNKSATRDKLFQNLNTTRATTIFYESPHRIMKSLESLNQNLPNSQIVVARELTKKFQEILRGTPGEVLQQIGSRTLKGEIVLLISNNLK